MNIDGVVFSDYEPTGDTFLDTMIHGKDIFDALHRIYHASVHGGEEVESFLRVSTDQTVNAILTDANVNIDASIECDELRRKSSERYAKELIVLTLIRRGHAKWVSVDYHKEDE